MNSRRVVAISDMPVSPEMSDFQSNKELFWFVYSGAQEEIILYNSDGYRSLLDIKYGRMGGGYAIPEFGLAYVRDICFFHPESKDQRRADMMVSACYCMNSPQLYDNPKSDAEVNTPICYI
jgi:hypothetical protein